MNRYARLTATLLLASGAWTAPSAGSTPGFELGWIENRGADTHALALGDVDADGDVDALLTDWYSPDLLWRNDGDGQFSREELSFGTGYGSWAMLAPLDAGASPDLWITRHLGASGVWTNDGLGGFSDSGQSLGPGIGRSGGALGDLDGDGDLDAFVPVNVDAGHHEVYLNGGNALFTPTGQELPAFWGRAVALGDVDGDLDLDALVGGGSTEQLWINDGTGQFTISGQLFGGHTTFDVELGDLDGDGDLDAVMANGSVAGEPNEIWENDGSGNFSLGFQSPAAGYSYSVELFDCDGDADLDALVGNAAGSPNRLLRNNGAGLLVPQPQDVGIGGTNAVESADLDGDADLDLFLANLDQPEQVLVNDGACHFQASGQILGGAVADSVALGDLDGDGDPDAALGTLSGITRILRNDGQGTFSDDDQWLGGGFGTAVCALRLADFDGDGDRDLWAGLCAHALLDEDPADRVFWNDGSGHFTDSGQRLGNNYTTGLAVGDVDGDGDLDVVASHLQSSASPDPANRLYLNDGSGGFTPSSEALGVGSNHAVVLGDLDGDGDLDLLFGNRSPGSKVLLNDGAGHFTDSGQTVPTPDVVSLALGDLDGDGDADAVVGNWGEDSVFENDGNGQLSDTGQTLGDYFTLAVHLLDVDDDEDLDAWTTSSGGLLPDPNKVWLNDGAGQFSDSGWSVGTLGNGESAVADIDGDSDLDLFIGSSLGDHQFWRNLLHGPIFEDGFESGGTAAWSSTVP